MYFVYMYIYISYIRKSGAQHGYPAAPGPGEAISHGRSSPGGGGAGEEPRELRDGHFPQPIIPPGAEALGRSPGNRVMAGGSHFPHLLHPINPGTSYLAAYK